jgi:Leucine-rich repeat (LRR) protein
MDPFSQEQRPDVKKRSSAYERRMMSRTQQKAAFESFDNEDPSIGGSSSGLMSSSIVSSTAEPFLTSPAYQKRMMDRELQKAAFASIEDEDMFSRDSIDTSAPAVNSGMDLNGAIGISAISISSTKRSSNAGNRRTRSSSRTRNGFGEQVSISDFGSFGPFTDQSRTSIPSESTSPSIASQMRRNPPSPSVAGDSVSLHAMSLADFSRETPSISSPRPLQCPLPSVAGDSASIHAMSLAEFSRDTLGSSQIIPARDHKSLNDISGAKLTQASWNADFFSQVNEDVVADELKKSKKKSKKKSRKSLSEPKEQTTSLFDAIAPPPVFGAEDSPGGVLTIAKRLTEAHLSATFQSRREQSLYPQIESSDLDSLAPSLSFHDAAHKSNSQTIDPPARYPSNHLSRSAPHLRYNMMAHNHADRAQHLVPVLSSPHSFPVPWHHGHHGHHNSRSAPRLQHLPSMGSMHNINYANPATRPIYNDPNQAPAPTGPMHYDQHQTSPLALSHMQSYNLHQQRPHGVSPSARSKQSQSSTNLVHASDRGLNQSPQSPRQQYLDLQQMSPRMSQSERQYRMNHPSPRQLQSQSERQNRSRPMNQGNLNSKIQRQPQEWQISPGISHRQPSVPTTSSQAGQAMATQSMTVEALTHCFDREAKKLSNNGVGAYHSDDSLDDAKKLEKALKEDEESWSRGPTMILGGLDQQIQKIVVTDVKLIKWKQRRRYLCLSGLLLLLTGGAVAGGIVLSALRENGDDTPRDVCVMPDLAIECSFKDMTFLAIPTCAIGRYEYLANTFAPVTLPNFTYGFGSCEPANLALWALATSTDGSELEEILVNKFFLGIFYYSTSGDAEWYNREGWLSDQSACTWFGVSCNSNAAVTRIDLDSNNLVGTLPAELGYLTSLETIWLHSNSLIRTIPTEFGQLQRLETLNLVGNKLEGTLPVQLTTIGTLRNMLLGYNSLTGSLPSELALLRNLEAFDIFNNKFEGIVATELAQCSMLHSLDLSQNRFVGTIPTQIGLLSNLKSLVLRGNSLQQSTIPSEFGLLTQLNELSLATASISGTIPTELGLATLLSSLQLDGNSLRGSIPRELMRLTNLKILRLSINNMTGTIPSELGLCTSLYEIELSYNNLTGTIPTELGALSNLDKLWLKGGNLGGVVPEEICALRDHANLKQFMADFCGGQLICLDSSCCECKL